MPLVDVTSFNVILFCCEGKEDAHFSVASFFLSFLFFFKAVILDNDSQAVFFSPPSTTKSTLSLEIALCTPFIPIIGHIIY